MAAMLQLPRSDGLALDVPDRAPGTCETCRDRAADAAGYCSPLCALFDAALTGLVVALARADGDRFAPDVVDARTWLRAVAAEYDAARLPRDDEPRRRGPGADDWTDDVAAGLLAPVAAAVLRVEVRRRAGIG